MAFTKAGTSMLRGRPPGFPSGIIVPTNAHCASVKSVAYVLIPVSKNLERSLRIRLVTARTFQTASKICDINDIAAVIDLTRFEVEEVLGTSRRGFSKS